MKGLKKMLALLLCLVVIGIAVSRISKPSLNDPTQD